MKSDFAIFSDDENTVVDHCWFRGGWFDPLTIAWESVKNAELKSVPPVDEGAPGASLYIPFTLAPGKENHYVCTCAGTFPILILHTERQSNVKENCDPESGCCSSPSQLDLDPYDKDFDGPFYKPWYSSNLKMLKK